MAAVLTAASSSTEPQWERSLCTRNGVGGSWLLREESRGRRNSIPPAQAPTARHMLAYLPRPPTDSSRYGTFPQKVGLRPGHTTRGAPCRSPLSCVRCGASQAHEAQ